MVIEVGSLLRYHSRDTLGYALKASNVIVDGVSRPIQKKPITDLRKISHSGLLKLVYDNGAYTTLSNVSIEEEKEGLLKPVFKDGIVLRRQHINYIRQNIFNQVHT